METSINTYSLDISRDIFSVLKSKAKDCNLSVNVLAERIFKDYLKNDSLEYSEPNDETKAAIEEARSGAEMETLDVDNFFEFVKSL